MPKLARIESVSADVTAMEVLQLIADYQRGVRACIAALKKQARPTDLLAAWKRGTLARSGRLVSPKGKYSFHGVGCCFEISGRVLDVDFGPNGRHDGFDSFRLAQFAESAFEWKHLSEEMIEAGMKRLEQTGTISSPHLEPSPHLFYLTEDLSNGR